MSFKKVGRIIILIAFALLGIVFGWIMNSRRGLSIFWFISWAVLWIYGSVWTFLEFKKRKLL